MASNLVSFISAELNSIRPIDGLQIRSSPQTTSSQLKKLVQLIYVKLISTLDGIIFITFVQINLSDLAICTIVYR